MIVFEKNISDLDDFNRFIKINLVYVSKSHALTKGQCFSKQNNPEA